MCFLSYTTLRLGQDRKMLSRCSLLTIWILLYHIGTVKSIVYTLLICQSCSSYTTSIVLESGLTLITPTAGFLILALIYHMYVLSMYVSKCTDFISLSRCKNNTNRLVLYTTFWILARTVRHRFNTHGWLRSLSLKALHICIGNVPTNAFEIIIWIVIWLQRDDGWAPHMCLETPTRRINNCGISYTLLTTYSSLVKE